MKLYWIDTQRDRDKQRRSWDDGGREWSDAATSHRIPRIASNCQKLGKRHGTDSLSKPPEGTNIANTLIFGLLTSRTVKEYISVVLSHQVLVVICYGSPRKLIHQPHSF